MTGFQLNRISLWVDWGNSLQDTLKKKERYVYLISENVGSFQTDARDSIVVLTHIAWAAIVTSVFKVSYDLQVRVWHTVHAYF